MLMRAYTYTYMQDGVQYGTLPRWRQGAAWRCLAAELSDCRSVFLSLSLALSRSLSLSLARALSLSLYPVKTSAAGATLQTPVDTFDALNQPAPPATAPPLAGTRM